MKRTLLTLLATGLLALTQAFAQYTQTTVVSSLNYPVAFDIAPDGRYFVTQKGCGFSLPTVDGRIRVFSSAGVDLGIFYDLTDSVNCDFERGLLGITVDPDFSTNGYVYVYYNHNTNPSGSGDERIRIVRFTDVNNVGTNPTIIFDLDVANNIAGTHVGGNLHFRPSDPNNIYFTIGDLAYQQGNPTLNYANKLTNPYGKHLRIGKSGLNVVPTDNPFYDDGNPLATNCDWIWAYGFRNPFDFCFSAVSDSMYSSENGWNTWDEMNMVHKGSFYGWADCEGFYVNGSTSTLCTAPGAVDPIEDWGTPLPALTGILYYSSQVMPEFDNHILICDNDYGRIYDITLGNAPVYDQFVSRVQWMDATTSGGLTTLKQGADGCVYAMKGGYTTTGAIYRICPQGLYADEPAAMFSEVNVSPNPFAEACEISYVLPKNSRVTATLYDVTGRKVADVADLEQHTGVQRIRIDAQSMNLKAGAYFCTLSAGNSTHTVKLLVTE